MSKRILNLIIISVLSLFLCVLITNPEVCQNGTFNGILLCGRVIIPALFPFTTCVVFIINSGVCNKLRKISKITEFLNHLPAELFFIFIFSLMSGYPTGANLLNTALNNGNIKPKTAEKMLYFCVNAGPAFIISAVGCGILHSKALGVILVLSHTFSAFLLMFISNLLSPCEIDSKPIKTEEMHPVDNFINSVFIASKNVLNICSVVILFSFI